MFGRDVYHWWSFEEIEEEVRHAWRAADREYETYRERVRRLEEQHAAETVYLRQHNEAMMKAMSDYVATHARPLMVMTANGELKRL